MTRQRKSREAPRIYTIEAVSVKTGLPPGTIRRLAAQPGRGFPRFEVQPVGEFMGPVWNAYEIDVWCARRAAEVAEHPSRFEAGPYRDAERAEVTARRMNRFGVGACAVEKDGRHLVFVPVPDGVAPADVGDNLAELFPAVRFRLYDFGYADTA